MSERRASRGRRARCAWIPRRHHRCAGVLFEVVLALALFAGAAAFTLVSLRSVTGALERARTRQVAIDLARTKLAELEAGLVTISELRGEIEYPPRSASDDAPSPNTTANRWRIELASERSEFTGLSLVRLTVAEALPAESAEPPLQITLRQLMKLRDFEATSQ